MNVATQNEMHLTQIFTESLHFTQSVLLLLLDTFSIYKQFPLADQSNMYECIIIIIIYTIVYYFYYFYQQRYSETSMIWTTSFKDNPSRNKFYWVISNIIAVNDFVR